MLSEQRAEVIEEAYMRKSTLTFEEIEQMVITNPLIGIDTILQVLSETNHESHFPHNIEVLRLFSQAILASQKADEETWKDNPSAELFRRELGQQTRHFIGVCFLRLLASCNKCFQAESFHHKAFELLDDVFIADIYKYCNINKNEQTYIKESKLKDVVPSIEREISAVIASLSSFDSLAKPTFRKSFMEVLMYKKAQIIVLPFLPQNSQNALTLRLNELFSEIEQYLKESEPGMLQAFERAQEDLAGYLQEVEQYGTRYSQDFLGGVIRKFLELLTHHFEQSPVSKPAHLTVMKLDKKYPMSIAGGHFDVGVTVRNEGPGHAFNVFLKVDSDLSLRKSEIYLGHLDPTSTDIEIPVRVDAPMDRAEMVGELSWMNFDKTPDKTDFYFEMEGQRADINWESLQVNNPYDLEPVTTEVELVGRAEILDKLVSQSQAKSVGSSYIYGQKRVGKTSIARTLKTRLLTAHSTSYLVVYLEMGDCIDPDARITIKQLGKRLCREIQRNNPQFSQLPIPEFGGSLSPLSDFLESIIDIAPDFNILFILDEFDEIPRELYRRSPLGDAFFLTIRSISGKQAFGFILVGGEKMEYLLSNQGERLNKFDPVRVDYFDREKHWSDFKDLVQRPVANYFEISDAAYMTLYAETAGNPYFTKLICRSLFKLLVNQRDCHVTPKEVEEATRQAIQSAASNSFQHFWEDGIVDTDERVEERVIIRRKVLVALAEVLKHHPHAWKAAILEQAVKQGLAEREIELELQDFVRRQILLVKEDVYQCKVPFFRKWLQEKGSREIITTFVEPDLIAKYRRDEEEAYVRPDEVINLLTEKEMYYKGRHLSEERIRAWLNQFSTNIEQRLMFRILQKFVFYHHSAIRVRLNEAHEMVRAGSRRYIKQRERKREDILVSYLDGPGKSGATYASLYVEQAEIVKGNVIERGRLRNVLSAIARRPRDEQPHTLVFIDDFIGTGESACKCFKQINAQCGDLLRASQLRIFFITLSGFEQGKQKIEEVLREINLNVRVRVCELLGEENKCFSESSSLFSEILERERAKTIAYRYGVTLVPDHPLGYGECQAAIAFEDSCPNNTLPIFWSDAHGWIPLFKRD
jgi:hypothetical protein